LIVAPFKPVELILGQSYSVYYSFPGQMILVIAFARMRLKIPMTGNAFFVARHPLYFPDLHHGIGLFI
jgi:hypothetical protein